MPNRPWLPMMMMLVTAAGLPAAVLNASGGQAVERIPDGTFATGDLDGWEAKEGSRMQVVDGALRVQPGAREAKIQWRLGQGHAGKILVWRGRVRAAGSGDPVELWLYTADETYQGFHWLVQAQVRPGPEWQDFALVVPVPTTNAHRAIIGARRVGGSIEIDDWSASLR